MRNPSIVLFFVSAMLMLPLAQAQPGGFASPPRDGHTIVCESHDKKYRECPTRFRGPAVLVENISDTRCLQGRNWGDNGRGSVWVQGGCRARFAEAASAGGGAPSRPGAPVRPGGVGSGQLVRCESDNGRYRECRMPGRARIELVRQLSSADCIQGRTWGVRDDRVWVNNGCRAEFSAFGGAWSGGGWGGSIICASEDQRTVTCPWNARQGRPRLLEQISSATCREGRSWGQTRDGDIWVSQGCRGRFGGR
ncbi:MAG: DUF3011 domain-containing protein [Burkholderiaceae bacterium]|jgi:hypothetical protein|nr:DUF3011 domain-containing protein [Burkholderiaceae bacterium]